MSFYPQAIWRPGPLVKQNGGTNLCHGVVLHSMVGSFAAALGELDNPARQASWGYSVLPITGGLMLIISLVRLTETACGKENQIGDNAAWSGSSSE